MMVSHDWLTPTIGGRPWLERPPLPQWITVAFASVIGRCDAEWIVRLPAMCMAILVVLLVAWTADHLYGRNIGMLSGLILATMWEFFFYASNPEADIYLCAIVTGVMALFVKTQFPEPDAQSEGGLTSCSPSLCASGSVPWFFILLGMTNLAKGLIFGTLMVLVPVAAFLLLSKDWSRIRRYVSPAGWLAFAVVAGAWPLAIYLQHPDIIELWSSDYLGRLNHGHVAEPPWYYLTALPWVMLPWTIPALFGLWLTRKRMLESASPERFLWCWALVTPAFFSLPDGKHHHYLLQCLAPWAILGALGAVRLWKWVGDWPGWLRNPAWIALLVGVPAGVAIAVFASRIPGPSWVIAAGVIGVPLWLTSLALAATWRNGARAATAIFALWGMIYWASSAYQAQHLNSYEAETEFLTEVRTMSATEKFLIHFDADLPLETFRLLFYSDARAVMLPNLTFLLDERIVERKVLVLARLKDARRLAHYGTPEIVLKCAVNRGLSRPDGNRALFRLTFHDDLPRRSADVYMTPMQVVHRAPGPFLR